MIIIQVTNKVFIVFLPKKKLLDTSIFSTSTFPPKNRSLMAVKLAKSNFIAKFDISTSVAFVKLDLLHN